jgi:hypothetical protein
MIHFDADRIRMVLEKPEGRLNGYPHSKIIWKMLQGLYKRQTSMEKEVQATIVDNGMGFNGYDGNFLTDVAQKSLKYKNLTPAQTKVVAKKLKKYVKQLVEIANEHQDVPAPLPKRSSKRVPEQTSIEDILEA